MKIYQRLIVKQEISTTNTYSCLSYSYTNYPPQITRLKHPEKVIFFSCVANVQKLICTFENRKVCNIK